MFTGRQAHPGEGACGREPNWGPLLALAPSEIDDFMWMFEVEMEPSNLYREVDPERLLRLVLERRRSPACPE